MVLQYIRYGVCVPNNCDSDDIAGIANLFIDQLASAINISRNFSDHFKLNSSWVQIQEPRPLDAFAISTLNLISIIVAIIAIGTI